MLAKRIIPTLLCRGRQLVKGVAFDAWRSVGLAAQAVRIHQQRGVDELVLLDISATAEGRGPDLKLIEELTAKCFMPLAVGGGIRSVQDVRDLLNAGADKIVFGSAAIEAPHLISKIAFAVGSQAVAVSIDVLHGRVATRRNGRVEALDTLPGPRGIADQCRAAQDLGAGEILLQSVERDGTMQGYDLEMIAAVSRAVSIPVIASGGAGTYEDFHKAILAGADAVAAGAMFQFTDQTPKGAAEYLAAHNIEVRL